ncbi:hypothetical protein FSP39_017244 [Pinctada imbricata]|uniref:Uncharacterized protein n=1 Tax=Pinctada imbricata TaxID=66713 RepID=A0AA89BPY4_PINIB|nr:hypothetical protein FSP39_017244 [Pinctada imbricata]
MPPPPNYDSEAMDRRLPYEVSPDAYDKPPMPQSDVGNGTGLPYGLNPGSTPSTAPYPSAPGYPSGNPPYPSGNAPYPSGNAPYPNY